MPRKKQTVQKKRRQKVYSEGEFEGEASKVKPKGAFRVFTNYRLFAIIGATALIIGVLISALYNPGSGAEPGSVRGEGVFRRTPEAGETSVTGAADNIKQYNAPPAMVIDTTKSYTAVIKTDKGDIKVELLDDAAPQTVNNFVFLAREGFYDGVTFHRVIDDLLAQTGDPTGTGADGPGYELPQESQDDGIDQGVVVMAKKDEAGAENNGSQFFIMLRDEPAYDGKFTVFGRVVEGLDVAQSLTPRDPIVNRDAEPGDRVQSITIEEVQPANPTG
ncbi:MAG TPA: peptidylprolyl isomerase [Dehalococcoidia bacterium]|jgi:cyclophilin family peptidyl-prolyl cis-trans isomerase